MPDIKHVQIDMSKELDQKLEQLAKLNDRSKASMVRVLIEQASQQQPIQTEVKAEPNGR